MAQIHLYIAPMASFWRSVSWPPRQIFFLGTIEAIFNTISSGWGKVLTFFSNKFGEVVTNPNNNVQYAHNHKFEQFLYMQQGFTHTSFGVGTIQPLLINFT